MRTIAAGLVFAALLALSEPASGRSFVGRKLPDYTFVDTEGRGIKGKDYEGSVLVMITGVPW